MPGSYTANCNLYQPADDDYVDEIAQISDNIARLDAFFGASDHPAVQSPRAFLRETAHAISMTSALDLLNLQMTWNSGSRLRGILLNVATHTAAGATSRPIEIDRAGNAIFDVDVSTEVAVNGVSVRGSATGAPAKLVAIGTDANVGIQLVPKGTGQVSVGGGGLVADALAPDVGRMNYLTNPGFEVWQRGTGSFVTDAAYFADRWIIALGPSSTVTITRATANVDSGSQYCANVVYLAASVSHLTQKIEDYLQLRGRTLTFTMRVRASVANAVRLRLDDGVTQTNGAYHTGGGAYETLSVTQAISAAATQVAASVRLEASGTIQLDNATLCIGSVAVSYTPLHPQDDLARCLRYYELLDIASGGQLQLAAIATGAGQQQTWVFPYRAIKPVAPIVTKAGTWTVNNCAQPTVSGGVAACSLSLISTAAGMFNAVNSGAGTTVSIESNP